MQECWMVHQILPPIYPNKLIKDNFETNIFLKLQKCVSLENVENIPVYNDKTLSLPNSPLKNIKECDISLTQSKSYAKNSRAKKCLTRKAKNLDIIDIDSFKIKSAENSLKDQSQAVNTNGVKPLQARYFDITPSSLKFDKGDKNEQSFEIDSQSENLRCIKFYDPLENISNKLVNKTSFVKKRSKKVDKNFNDKQQIKINTFLVPQSPQDKKTQDLIKEYDSSETTVKAINQQSPKQFLTDYFPIVKRSQRRCKVDIENEKQDFLEKLILSNCEDGLKVEHFGDKGRGVVATKVFLKDSFVVEYAGDLIIASEAKIREAKYKTDNSIGCYMYYFELGGKQLCVDATAETGRLGRLVNHSRKFFNCRTKALYVHVEHKCRDGDKKTRKNPSKLVKEPKLILIATRDIGMGEEFLYDYGERDKETLKAHPWLLS